MEYKSPIPILKYAGSNLDQLDATQLLRVQKRLLVELDLSGGGSLTIEGQQLTKDDILSVIENLKGENYIKFHKWIYENPSLLKLIQQGDIDSDKELFDGSLAYHYHFKDFKVFISPYLERTLGKAISQAFQKRDFTKAGRLLQGNELLTPVYFDATFGKLKHAIQSLISDIKQAEHDSNYYFHRENFAFINYTFITFLNNLPEGLAQLREEMATALINLSVHIQNKEVDFCYTMYMGLKALRCNGETKKIIEKNLNIFIEKKKQQTPGISKGENSSSGRGCLGIGGLAFFIFIIVRACIGTFSNHASTVFENNTKTEQADPAILQAPKIESTQATEEVRANVENDKDLVPVSQMLRDHHILKQQFEKLTLKQMKAKQQKEVDLVVAAEEQPAGWTYNNYFRNLASYQPEDATPIQFTNRSEYDVVLFVINKEKLYYAFLAKKEKLKTNITNEDMVSVYIGNEWNKYTKLNYNSSIGSKREWIGTYSKVDSTTLVSLNSYWRFQCKQTKCDTSKVEFNSPLKETFRFSDPDNRFRRYDGSEIF